MVITSIHHNAKSRFGREKRSENYNLIRKMGKFESTVVESGGQSYGKFETDLSKFVLERNSPVRAQLAKVCETTVGHVHVEEVLQSPIEAFTVFLLAIPHEFSIVFPSTFSSSLSSNFLIFPFFFFFAVANWNQDTEQRETKAR